MHWYYRMTGTQRNEEPTRLIQVRFYVRNYMVFDIHAFWIQSLQLLKINSMFDRVSELVFMLLQSATLLFSKVKVAMKNLSFNV